MARWVNWSGLVECIPERILAPKSLDELQAIVRHAATTGRCVCAVGSGHSCTELVKTGDIILSLDNLARLDDVDPVGRMATVWAGAKLHYLSAEELTKSYPKWKDFQAIGRRLDPNGLFSNKPVNQVLAPIGSGAPESSEVAAN